MKRFIFIVLLLFPVVLFSQIIDLRIPTTIGSSGNADSLGNKAPSFYVDTLNDQDISGSKVFKDDLVLDSTLSIGVSSPAATSILDIVSITKGLLQPRMTEAQRDAISTPAEGLEVYDLTGNVPNFYNGTEWRRFSHTTSASLEEGGIVISEFAKGSALITDSANFYWDNTAKRLGIGTSNPDSASILDLSSTTKGFLPPRLTTTQKNAIPSPVPGLMVFDTDKKRIEFYDGTAWTYQARTKTGTYLADGTTSFAITGIGFQPIYVKIWRQSTAGQTLKIFETTNTIVNDDASGGAIRHADTAGENAFLINKIISLDTDGFTVDDDGTDSDPNKDGRIYNFLAIE